MATNPKIKIVGLEKDLVRAIKLIDRFLKINDIKIKYSISLDYNIKDYGLFYQEEKTNIVLNPKAFSDTSKEDPHAPYYSTDFSILAVAIHEFVHMLVFKYDLKDAYRKTFGEKFILNENSRKDWDEEMAEVGRLYFLNPYLLKIVNPKRYKYLRKLFQSPTPCTKSNFLKKWNKWPREIQELCSRQWGIEVLDDKIFIR